MNLNPPARFTNSGILLTNVAKSFDITTGCNILATPATLLPIFNILENYLLIPTDEIPFLDMAIFGYCPPPNPGPYPPLPTV